MLVEGTYVPRGVTYVGGGACCIVGVNHVPELATTVLPGCELREPVGFGAVESGGGVGRGVVTGCTPGADDGDGINGVDVGVSGITGVDSIVGADGAAGIINGTGAEVEIGRAHV